MDQDNAPNNVIQFPGKRKEAEANNEKPAAPAKKPARKKPAKKTLAATVLAVILATGAVNRYVFETQADSFNLSSASPEQIERGLASVERFKWERDAAWEKDLAESLASSKARQPASANIGRTATQEEKLRWGILEEKYNIQYQPNQHRINSIQLQDATATPAYVLDRVKFLRDYGPLFEAGYHSAKLKSVQTMDDRTIESYTVFGKDNQPKGEVRFELDQKKRLLSLKVESAQI